MSHSLSVPAVKGVCWTEDQRAVGVSIKPPIRNPPTRDAGDGLKIFPAARTQDGTLVWKRDLVEECGNRQTWSKIILTYCLRGWPVIEGDALFLTGKHLRTDYL